jgi:hypothetical protein
MQKNTLQPKASKAVMRAAWKWNWVLLAALFVVTLAVIFARYSQRPTATPDINTSSAPLKPQGTSVATRRTHFQDFKAGNLVENTSIPATEAQEKNAINDKSKRPVTSLSGIDESVVGQAFQVSASVKEGCKSDTVECPLVMASVARMVQEPRDIEWAANMEEKIQSAVDMQGPGKYVIRNLECRTSTCILEVEIHVPGAFNGRYEDVIFSSLRPNAMTISAPEYDSSGARFSVELMDFARR